VVANHQGGQYQGGVGGARTQAVYAADAPIFSLQSGRSRRWCRDRSFLEDGSLRRHCWLLRAPLWQKIGAAQSVDLGKDCCDIRAILLDRFQQDAAPDPAHAHFGAGHAKFLRQADRLTAAVFEKLCRPRFSHEKSFSHKDRYRRYSPSGPGAPAQRVFRGQSLGPMRDRRHRATWLCPCAAKAEAPSSARPSRKTLRSAPCRGATALESRPTSNAPVGIFRP